MSNIIIIKLIMLISILVVMSFNDIKYRIISNKLVAITLFIGIIFVFLGTISFYKAILGMLVGGGIMFILSLVPNTLGGGDIKLMFALGVFLGPIKILGAIIIGFIFAAVVSIILLILKIIDKNEYIPFGPFLALGTIIAYVFI